LDETFIHKNLVTNKILVCDEKLPEIKLPIGRGDRYSIIHAALKMVS
jgi:hypothetical protein